LAKVTYPVKKIFEVASLTSAALRPERISEQAVEFLFADGIALARALFDLSSI